MTTRNVILYLAESLDGFIADKDGSVNWLQKTNSSAADADYQRFYHSIDTVLMGRKTYQQALRLAGNYPYQDKDSYVFSTTLHNTDDPSTVVAGNIAEFVRKLKAQPGKDIWLVGGADIFTDLLEAQLIDKIVITIAPVLLGEGIPLVTTQLTNTPLKLETTTQLDQFVSLTYSVLPA
ncbi:dihydrofolate reductase family protein [Lacticaseibacillus saniviri]